MTWHVPVFGLVGAVVFVFLVTLVAIAVRHLWLWGIAGCVAG